MGRIEGCVKHVRTSRCTYIIHTVTSLAKTSRGDGIASECICVLSFLSSLPPLSQSLFPSPPPSIHLSSFSPPPPLSTIPPPYPLPLYLAHLPPLFRPTPPIPLSLSPSPSFPTPPSSLPFPSFSPLFLSLLPPLFLSSYPPLFIFYPPLPPLSLSQKIVVRARLPPCSTHITGRMMYRRVLFSAHRKEEIQQCVEKYVVACGSLDSLCVTASC